MTTLAAHRDLHLINSVSAWQAVEQRDGSYDGQFVYGVGSTHIYCKPSCPSRRPSRTHVRFFATPDQAEAGGYRACLRCKPRDLDAATATMKGVEAALAYLDSHTDRAVHLAELASHAKLSTSHLQRSFKKLVGVSPKQYQDARRLTRFKSRLRAGDTVSRATYDAGFGSSSRVYEKSDAALGMTPAAFRRGGAGVQICYTIADAPIGRVLVATTERGVCAVEIGVSDAEVEHALTTDFPHAIIERDDDSHDIWVRAVLDRIRNPANSKSNRIPLDVNGTAFQLKVWAALEAIPVGERRSYREVAASIGQPSATRAVARACATNRVAVIIPCHRVVRESGDLAGYKWGVDRKKRLLDQETN